MRTVEDVSDWLVGWLARRLDCHPEEMSDEKTFMEYGLDSAGAVALIHDLNVGWGCALEPVALFQYATIQALSIRVAEGE